jgi:PKD repeat protein
VVDTSGAATDRWSGATLSWNFGDGATATGVALSHAYGAPGVYTVTTTATDGAGNPASTTRTIQISNPPPRILVSLSFRCGASDTATTLTSFTVKRIPSGSTLTVSCEPPGRRAKCPAKKLTKWNAMGTVKLSSFSARSSGAGPWSRSR